MTKPCKGCKTNGIRLIATDPPTEGKFVAMRNNGSGAELFMFNENGQIVNSDRWFIDEYNLDDFLFWIPLPDSYEYWSEK